VIKFVSFLTLICVVLYCHVKCCLTLYGVLLDLQINCVLRKTVLEMMITLCFYIFSLYFYCPYYKYSIILLFLFIPILSLLYIIYYLLFVIFCYFSFLNFLKQEPELHKAMVLLLARCWDYRLKTEDVLELTQVSSYFIILFYLKLFYFVNFIYYTLFYCFLLSKSSFLEYSMCFGQIISVRLF
jgi:hypothetical protein